MLGDDDEKEEEEIDDAESAESAESAVLSRILPPVVVLTRKRGDSS